VQGLRAQAKPKAYTVREYEVIDNAPTDSSGSAGGLLRAGENQEMMTMLLVLAVIEVAWLVYA
jgi:hypothetical protein